MVNWTKIKKSGSWSLEDGIEDLQLGGFQGGVTLNAERGKPYGVLYGTTYVS